MIALSLILGALLLVFVARTGRAGLARLATMRLRGGYLALLACLTQTVSMLTHQQRLPLLLACGVLLAVFCWLNRRQAGMIIITLGVGLNMAAMIANGGTMPINQATLAQVSGRQAAPGTALLFSKDRVLEDSQATFAWMGARLVLPGPLTSLAAWSIGDLLLLAGVGRLLWLR